MLKENILRSLLKSEEMLNNGKEKFPLGVRGELEVIVKDKYGNITDYQKGHNTVTDWTKMQVIHLLAGEIFTKSNNLYSTGGTNDLILNNEAGDGYLIPQKINLSSTAPSHSTAINTDGYLVSGESTFFSPENTISQFDYTDTSGYVNYNTPTKMLFGTGMEASNLTEASTEYSNEQSVKNTSVSNSIIATSNGFSSINDLDSNMFPPSYLNNDQNYYSSSTKKVRTLQPLTLNTIPTEVSSTSTSIKGAIKNSYITSSTDFYDNTDENSSNMATASHRGMGLPSFIAAKRDNDNFYVDTKNNVYIQKSEESSKYEDKITYSVVMPNTQGSFYPYTGWILKEAGLFCDSRLIFSRGGDLPIYPDEYTKMPSGILMFKRNITPVVKAEDSEVEFRWSIIISS